MLRRLHLSRALSKHLTELPSLRSALSRLAEDVPPSRAYELLHGHSEVALLAAYAIADDPIVKERLQRYRQQWRLVKPALAGADLAKLGLRPGPIYGQILQALRGARLDGKVTSREQEQELAQALAISFQPSASDP